MTLGIELTWLIAMVAALIGSAMGLMSFCVPRWGASVVRLAPDPRLKGGWAEFRASYGGAILLPHMAVLLTMAMSFQAGTGAVIGASFIAATYWLGMAIGRIISMIVDQAEQTLTRYNAMGVGFELVMAVALAMPFVAHLGG